VWDRITARRFTQDPRAATRGQKEPDFLNADLFKDAVLGVRAAFSDHAGAFRVRVSGDAGKDQPSRRRGRKSSTAS